jgi:hypothetical protein
MTFLAMVVCRIGTAFAARAEHASLRSVGVFSNQLLLWGIAFELTLAAMVIALPPLQNLLDTAALPPRLLVITLPFPFIVWGADELRVASHPSAPPCVRAQLLASDDKAGRRAEVVTSGPGGWPRSSVSVS